VAREQPDVVCLQELKAERHQIPPPCHLDEYHAFFHGMKAYSGVSLHIRKELIENPKFEHPAFDMESRIVQAGVGDTVFASVYVPNGNKNYPAKVDFFRRLIAWARQVHADGKNLVLCGDMNITRTEMDVHPRERRVGVIGQLPEERALFADLLGEHLVDVHRKLEPENDRLFTWWAPWRQMRERNIGWRLDYILASPAIAGNARRCVVQIEFGTSDHGPVVATFG
jgi:exodeoxyribonuclease-3